MLSLDQIRNAIIHLKEAAEMATIAEKKKDGKVVAFKFFHCIGRDEKGKQHFRTTTWKPPQNLTYAKAKKMAEVEAYRWEQSLMGKADQPHGELTSPT